MTTDAARLMRRDSRAPVLYLRSFRDDEAARRTIRIGSYATEELAVDLVVQGFGPYICLGRTEQPGMGAARGEVTDMNWRHAVTWLLAQARLVVLRCATSPSLLWEFQQAVTILRPEQVLLLVPDDRDSYRDFQARTAHLMPCGLPDLPDLRSDRIRLAALIRFMPGWRPEVLSLRDSLPRRLLFSLHTRLARKLRPVVRQLEADTRYYRIRSSAARAMIVVDVAAPLLLASVTTIFVGKILAG